MSASTISNSVTYDIAIEAGVAHGKNKLLEDQSNMSDEKVMRAYRATLKNIVETLNNASLQNTIPTDHVEEKFTTMLRNIPAWLNMSGDWRQQVLRDISGAPGSDIVHQAGWHTAPLASATSIVAPVSAALPVQPQPQAQPPPPLPPPAPAPAPAQPLPLPAQPQPQPQQPPPPAPPPQQPLPLPPPPAVAAAVVPIAALTGAALQTYLNAAPVGSAIRAAIAAGVPPQYDPYTPTTAPNPNHGNTQWTRPNYEPAAAPTANTIHNGEFPDPQRDRSLRYFCPFCDVSRGAKRDMKAHIVSREHRYGTFPVNRWTLTPRRQR